MGDMKIGETPTQCAVRETRQETGLIVETVGLVGVVSDPTHVVAYANGGVCQEYEVVFLARPVSGTPTPNEEATDVRWVALSDLDTVDLHRTTRRQTDAHLKSGPARRLTWPQVNGPQRRLRR
jgi:8-oxo-dGTP pyrophosphatase MutT (NUDIX family)